MSSPTGIAPIEISADSVGLEGVRKLIEVGLLEAAPGAPEGEVRLRPTVKARPYFRERRRGVSGEVSAELCYARRKITRALLVGSDGKTLNFAYRLVDSPAWACDPRLQAAFPFLAPRSLGNWSRGHRPLPRWSLVPGSCDAAASIPGHHEGFRACPGEGARPNSGCRQDALLCGRGYR